MDASLWQGLLKCIKSPVDRTGKAPNLLNMKTTRVMAPMLVWMTLIGLALSMPVAGLQPTFAQTKGIWDGTLTQAKSGIWDDTYTHAKSGVEGDPIDPGNSDGKSGVKNPPWTFFIPPPRYYENVDPEQISDNKKKDYSPYALALFPQNFTYRGRAISKGYYLVKLGDEDGGSPKTNLHAEFPKEYPTVTDPVADFQREQEKHKTRQEKKEEAASAARTLILEQLGNVITVLPINRREAYKAEKGQPKKFKRALAEVVFENHVPLLKYYYKKTIYVTDLSQQ